MNRRAFFGLLTAAAFAKPIIAEEQRRLKIQAYMDWQFNMAWREFSTMMSQGVISLGSESIGVTGLLFHHEDLKTRLGIT